MAVKVAQWLVFKSCFEEILTQNRRRFDRFKMAGKATQQPTQIQSGPKLVLRIWGVGIQSVLVLI